MRSRFVYATHGNVPDLMLRDGKTYRIYSDYRGSPLLVVDVATGAVAQQMRYDAFGNVLEDTNPGFQPFGFAGGLYDAATGLLRFGARDYDPAAGRWTAADPLLFSAGPTNLYTYVGNDPVNYADPWGLDGDPISTVKGWLDEAFDLNDKVTQAKEIVESYDNRDDELDARNFKPPSAMKEQEELLKDVKKTADEGVDPFSKILQKVWWSVIGATDSSSSDDKGGSGPKPGKGSPKEPCEPCPPQLPRPLPKPNQYYGQY